MNLYPSPWANDGPVRLGQEAGIWFALMHQPITVAQPLTSWLALAMLADGYKRSLSTAVAGAMRVSHKTWEKGLPDEPEKLDRMFDKLSRHVDRQVAESDPCYGARRKRIFDDAMAAFRQEEGEPAFAFFRLAVGALAGDALEALAAAMDDLSLRLLMRRIPENERGREIVAAVEHTGQIERNSVGPAHDLDPSLDVALALLARIDRDCNEGMHRDEGSIASMFSLLLDTSPVDKPRSAWRRLFDVYYGLATFGATGKTPTRLPTIEQLEDALMGGPPESGGQSFFTRWRNGTKQLRLNDVAGMAAHIATQQNVDPDFQFRVLFLAAQLWSLVERHGPAARTRVGQRYRAWWEALLTPGRSPTALTDPYWLAFQPHA